MTEKDHQREGVFVKKYDNFYQFFLLPILSTPPLQFSDNIALILIKKSKAYRSGVVFLCFSISGWRGGGSFYCPVLGGQRRFSILGKVAE